MSLAQRMRQILWGLRAQHWLYLVLYLVLFVSGCLLVMLRSPVAVGIGSSLLAASVAGWVLFLHVWVSEERFRRVEVLHKFGLADAFESRSVGIKHQYDSRLARARGAIDILGFGLRHLREDYQSEFRSWAARAKVRILILDPEYFSTQCCIADQRDVEEGDTAGTIRRDVHAFVKAYADLVREGNPNFSVRLCRCLPSVNMFRIDNEMFWGPYLVGDVSRNFPTFLVERDGVLYRRLCDHFDAIWTDERFSRPIPEEWLAGDAGSSPD